MEVGKYANRKPIPDLVKPLIISGVYRDEISAIKDIYEETTLKLKAKYGKDFEAFTEEIKNKATIELE